MSSRNDGCYGTEIILVVLRDTELWLTIFLKIFMNNTIRSVNKENRVFQDLDIFEKVISSSRSFLGFSHLTHLLLFSDFQLSSDSLCKLLYSTLFTYL